MFVYKGKQGSLMVNITKLILQTYHFLSRQGKGPYKSKRSGGTPLVPRAGRTLLSTLSEGVTNSETIGCSCLFTSLLSSGTVSTLLLLCSGSTFCSGAV